LSFARVRFALVPVKASGEDFLVARLATLRFARVGVAKTAFRAATLVLLLAACSSVGTHAAPANPAKPIDSTTARFGQPFQLGKLTIVVSEVGSLADANPGAAPRRRLVINTENKSRVPDRAPGIAIVCGQEPRLSGGSVYADPHPEPRRFVAGRLERPGTRNTASIIVKLAPACPRPAVQISTGGATINGLPGPVVIPLP
jgi:hypothetical protein